MRAGLKSSTGGDQSRRLIVAGLGLVGALLVGALLEGTLTEPLLEDVGIVSLSLAVLLSAAVAASWWFLAAGIPIVVLSAIPFDDTLPFAVLGAIISAPFVFAALAGGVAVGRMLRGRARSSTNLVRAMVGCIALTLILGGVDALRPPVDKHPENPLTVDWRKGTYEGVALRSTSADLIARLGKPEKRGGDEPAEPIGEDYYDIGGPTSFGSPGRGPSEDETLRFEDRSFFATDGRISGWVTTSERAETPEGVGVGDSRELVKQRYPAADCRTGNEGTEYATFPLCEIRVCSGRLLVFGGDPIKSVWLAAETKKGWGRCLEPTQVKRSASS